MQWEDRIWELVLAGTHDVKQGCDLPLFFWAGGGFHLFKKATKKEHRE